MPGKFVCFFATKNNAMSRKQYVDERESCLSEKKERGAVADQNKRGRQAAES